MVGSCWGGGQGSDESPSQAVNRKPYNVARAPVLINLNLYFKPYIQPKTLPTCRL